MSSPPTTTRAPPPRPGRLVLQACQTDDTSLIAQALTLASLPTAHDSLDSILTQAVNNAIRRNATSVLTYVLTHGGSVPHTSFLSVENPSTSTLEILLSHGWDINARALGEKAFLWNAVLVSDELVAWCLDHGASPIPKDLHLESEEEKLKDSFGCPAILESAARNSTLKTFKLLHSKGAPLGRRTLHFAAASAFKTMETEEASFAERIGIVKHQVEDLGLEPNALDQPKGYSWGNHWGTPLCYVAKELSPRWDCEEVVKYLLEKGADPEMVMDPGGWSAVELARQGGNERLLKIFDYWRTEKASG